MTSNGIYMLIYETFYNFTSGMAAVVFQYTTLYMILVTDTVSLHITGWKLSYETTTYSSKSHGSGPFMTR